MSHYDHGDARAHIDSLGMSVDEPLLAEFDTFAHNEGLSQEQFTAVVFAHAKIIKEYFRPGRYDLKGRLMLAWHFLFGRG